MLTIRYSPQDFSFTSSIPDRIDISTDAASVKVAVMAGTTVIYSAALVCRQRDAGTIPAATENKWKTPASHRPSRRSC